MHFPQKKMTIPGFNFHNYVMYKNNYNVTVTNYTNNLPTRDCGEQWNIPSIVSVSNLIHLYFSVHAESKL